MSAEVATTITVPRCRGASITAGSPLSNDRATLAFESVGSTSLRYCQVSACVSPAVTGPAAPWYSEISGCR